MNHQISSKWTLWHSFLFLAGIIILTGISTFLAIILMEHFHNSQQLWEIATNMFTLFGILLAIGVAFALLATAVSFMSLNHKLHEAQGYLAQARLHLDEYKQLSSQKKLIEDKAYQLVKLHQALPVASVHEFEIQPIITLVKNVVSSEFADFEVRLLARAIQQDVDAKKAINYAQMNPDIHSWRDAVQQFEASSYLWKVLLSARSDILSHYFRVNYFSAQLNQATAAQHLAALNGSAQHPEHYRYLETLYAPVLAMVGKYKDADIGYLINQAAHQNAMLAYQEGEVLWQKNQDIVEVSQKWQDAKQYFQTALSAKYDDVESAYQYGSLLEREARLVAQTDAQRLPEAHQLWQQAREQYRYTLDILPSKAEAAFSWANTLSDEATALVQTNSDSLAEAKVLWHDARDKYNQAIDIKQDFDSAAYNAGMTFNKEADTILHFNQNVEEARSLWKQAGEQFQVTLSIQPSRCDAANSWGLVLAKEADLLYRLDADTHLLEAQRLWQLAQQRFHLALEIEPNLQAAATNWRTVLLNESSTIPNQADKLALWQVANDKVVALCQMSSNHASSVYINELAEVIRQQILKLESVNQLQPVAQLRSTASSSE